jgi:hypothetical protein
MPWKKDFETIDPVTREKTIANVKVNENGVVTDFLIGKELDGKDEDGNRGKHGHIWNLGEDEDAIGGRDPVNSSGESIYDDEEDYSDDIEASITPHGSEEQIEGSDFAEEDYSDDVEASITSQESEGQAESYEKSGESQDGVDGSDDGES